MGEIMVPTKEMTIQRISEMSEHDYKKVAIYVQNVTESAKSVSSADVKALTARFNEKYGSVFRALAQ